MSDFIISYGGVGNDTDFNIKTTGESVVKPINYTIDEFGSVIFNNQYPVDTKTNDGLIEISSDGMPLDPILVLSSRGGNKIGVIQNVRGIEQTHPLSEPAELSFDVYKEVNGVECANWDKIKDFKFVQIPRENAWFEAKVSVDEENDLVKHVTCVHANEAELGQLNLYDVEINTEADIDRDDYKETFFYNGDDPDSSLLHRILKDKAPHYQIYHVDDTLKKLFRQFSFNGTSIQDALNQIAEECNCLFVYGEWATNDGKYHRTISAYDLEDYCMECGKRGNYTEGVCTNCGSESIVFGYGDDTGIFISKENLANSISYETNTDEVKNCFRLVAGDDVMTSAIKACNPNMSQYIWYFSDDMLEDMSDELASKISEYNESVERYRTTEQIEISPELLTKYNELIDEYGQYNEDLEEIDTPIVGTTKLIEAYYKAINLYGFLKSELSPTSEEVQTTTAEEQMGILKTGDNMAKVGISDTSGTIPYTTANSAIASYAKVYIDTSRYKVTVFTTDITGTSWTGIITITSYVDEEDTVTEEFEITLFDSSDNDEYVNWVEQCVQKAMANKEATNLSIVDLFNKDESVSDFTERLGLYCLDELSTMSSMVTSAITIMVEQGVADQSNTESDVYEQLYEPYINKSKAIEAEIANRELQLSYLLQPTDDNGNTDPRYPSLGLIDEIESKQSEISNLLNIKEFLGDDLWEELSFYRRENEYQNPNYISDGLTDGEIIQYAQRFYEEANKEIVKSATLQHTISAPLKDFLLMEDFYPLQKKFKVGNWMRLQVDGKVYKLRLSNWTIDYDDIEDLDIEFTDVVRIGNIISDTQSILSKSRSMATTYSFVARQADKGKDASETLRVYKDSGIDFSKIKAIVSRGNTNIVYDDDGILLKRVDGVDILPEQARIYNNGIYITRDAWETVSTGLGHYSYVDPETGETVETYGIIADTVIGRLILGNNLKIYSESKMLQMGDDGLVITSDGTSQSSENRDLFVLQKKTRENDQDVVTKYIYVDEDGNVKINGSTVIVSGTDTYSVDDARKQATNYLSVDNTGIMVANMTNGVAYTPSQIQTGNNVFISNSDIKIRDGQTQLASYGETITVGKTGTNLQTGEGNNNVYIDSNGVDIREDLTSVAHFGETTRIGSADDSYIQINTEGITGNKNAIVGYNDQTPIVKNIETFAVYTGQGEIYKDTSSPIYKSSGDEVSHQFNFTYSLENNNAFSVITNIYLVDGTKQTTPIRVFSLNEADSSGLIEEGWIDFVDTETKVDQQLTYIYNFDAGDDFIVVTIDDSECPSQGSKIDYIIITVLYNYGGVEYPHYRFGTHNAYTTSYNEQEYTEGKFSFDIGEDNITTGNYSFAHGNDNASIGYASFTSGSECVASESYAHAEGNGNVASGVCSHVEGYLNQSNGDYSHVSGVGNVARYTAQTIIGKYAPIGTSDDAFVVGNGTDSDNRSYAMRLRTDGHVEFKGAVGTGLAWDSRTEMIEVVGSLLLYRPYNFFATSRNTSGNTIYWSTVAGAEDGANAFGTICKMSTTTWQIYFMCSGKFYTSIFNLDTTDPTQSTFNTSKLLTQNDTLDLLRQYNLIS